MLGEIGTLAWTRRTNGLLNRPERLRYVAAAVREQARAAAPLLAFRLGRGARRQAAIDEHGPTMFHDAGALEPDRSDGGRCFTLKGAADAESHAVTAGWPAERCAAAAEAAALGTGFGLALKLGPWQD